MQSHCLSLISQPVCAKILSEEQLRDCEAKNVSKRFQFGTHCVPNCRGRIIVVFYNNILNCFVVFELKAGKLSYQDVGQIDFYVRLFDEKIKQADDNPTIGIVLVADKDESIVKYSVLAENEKLFASKYRLYLPTEEELKAELIRERELIEREIEDTGGHTDEVEF
jgi:hypothetical protein